MADFCHQCSLEDFGEDLQELNGLGGDTPLPPGHGYNVICEGCGFILVDKAGQCLTNHCLRHHSTPATIYLNHSDKDVFKPVTVTEENNYDPEL